MKNKWLVILGVLLVFGLLFSACDSNGNNGNNGNNELTLRGYSKDSKSLNIKSLNIAASMMPSRSVDGTYNSSDYRFFSIDNHGGKPVTDQAVTLEAIRRFEQEVPGYKDTSDGYKGYLSNYSAYPSDARETGIEGVYLVFDNRDPAKKYQAGWTQINKKVADSNPAEFEKMITEGKIISIFHINAANLGISATTCWLIQWNPES